MTKRKTPPQAEPTASRTLHHVAKPGETRQQLIAKVAAAGMLENAATVQAFGKGTMGEIGITEAVHALRERADAVSKGDLSGAEAMLVAQASSLNAIFAEMARRAAANMGEYLSATETYLRLALKAQAQCRATLETLATIQAGPVVIARQANIAHGPQQVNNGVSSTVRADARAGNSEPLKNELMEVTDGED
ncbi:hypothetical protein [Quisquiliibacterium transsilvanicum]|uniref:Uncharacterized protein n=1 Tax=Quisquiliibacterium transsilvanicum TaxID=1549638 RepID=A0A7W8M8X1_9BURK|nr:hypothetical protein [Quisquiliibacterium transsilvanicum]MBB5272233.1 hypothetical protein [Quisquiliibacterium transsilvanicum]